MSDIRTVDVVIQGRVQGVGYRDWTRRRAEAHGLSGSVRNCADGSVAAIFSGTAEPVTTMLAECAAGPSGARVDDVAVAERPGEAVPAGFAIAWE